MHLDSSVPGTEAPVTLSRRVLVLNASYEPLSLIPVRRAIVLLMERKAELIESGKRVIRTVSRQLPIPLIIRLSHFVRVPRRESPPSRNAVMLRDAHTCAYCGQQKARNQLTIDHVVPRSRGGSHAWTNLVTACQRCNQFKGHRTLEEARMKLLWQPSQPSHVTLVLLRNPVAAERYRLLVAGEAAAA